MEHNRLAPFDAETFIMIACLIGHDPDITEKEDSFDIKIYSDDKNTHVVRATIDAVFGRYGKRIKHVRYINETVRKVEILRGAIFTIEYEKDAGNYPNEIRTYYVEPNENAGHLFCRKLMEIRAVPVTRDNLKRLIEFTGGGTMTIPRKPGGTAIYSFPTENGVMLDVEENDVVVRYDNGRFAKMDEDVFYANFEPKDAKTAEQYIQFETRFNKVQ